MKLKKLVTIIFCLVSFLSFSQSIAEFKIKRDSLMLLKNDSVKTDKLMDLAIKNLDSNFVECMRIANFAAYLADSLQLFKRKAKYYNKIGDFHFNRGDYQESFKYYFNAYKLSDSIKSKYYLALSAYNLGWQAAIQQKNYKDVSYIYMAQKIGTEINSAAILLRTQNALGSFYTDKYDREHLKSDFDSAVMYFTRAIDGTKELKRFAQIGALYQNLGQLFFHSKDYTSSIFYYEKAKGIFKNDSNNIVSSMHKIAMCTEALGNGKAASDVYQFVYRYTTRMNISELKKESLYTLMEYYYKAGEYQKAYDYQKEYHKVVADIGKELNALSIKNLEVNYDFKKSEADNVQLKQSAEIQELKNKRKTFFITLLVGIAVIVLIIAYLLFKQNRLRQDTNNKLTKQNKIISEKKLEIEQSIAYAKGIQTAFLPAKEELNYLVKENFIFYKPKDVVSGDFYWFLPTTGNNTFLLACSDCTGHGVPGALMSMIGINTLQQLSVERKLESPGLILKILNAEIKNSLKQNSDQNKQRDGMDIALVHVDLAAKKLKYAAANRPLYIIRKGEVLEYKATKQAIGGYTKYDQTFDETEIALEQDDLICLTTDGYADQFGGPEAKKFMTKNLKALLSKISPLSASEQLVQLESVFNNWKDKHEQIDDVCVIGLKV